MYSFVSSRFPNACRVLTPLSESRILRSYWLQRFLNVRLCVDNKTRRYIKKIQAAALGDSRPTVKDDDDDCVSVFSVPFFFFKLQMRTRISRENTTLLSCDRETRCQIVKSMACPLLLRWSWYSFSFCSTAFFSCGVITDHTEICSASTCLTSLCSVSAWFD